MRACTVDAAFLLEPSPDALITVSAGRRRITGKGMMDWLGHMYIKHN